MSGVSAGRLRHRVELQDEVITQDPTTGEELSAWTTVATLWADVVPMSAREFYSAGAEQSEVSGRITIRYREGVDSSMRFIYRGKYYNILGVMPDAESGYEHITLPYGEGVRVD